MRWHLYTHALIQATSAQHAQAVTSVHLLKHLPKYVHADLVGPVQTVSEVGSAFQAQQCIYLAPQFSFLALLS
jgi:hypothetical protein